jgi:hypothetical protein
LIGDSAVAPRGAASHSVCFAFCAEARPMLTKNLMRLFAAALLSTSALAQNAPIVVH